MRPTFSQVVRLTPVELARMSSPYTPARDESPANPEPQRQIHPARDEEGSREPRPRFAALRACFVRCALVLALLVTPATTVVYEWGQAAAHNPGAFRTAVENGDFAAMEDAPAALVHAPDETGQTPIMWATTAGRADVVRWLLRRGARVNECHPDTSTPLCLAVVYQPKLVPLLLEAGADPNLHAPGRLPPLELIALTSEDDPATAEAARAALRAAAAKRAREDHVARAGSDPAAAAPR